MEELWELRRYLKASDVAGALALLDEMEAMAKDDKIDRMASYIQVLLVQLLKQAVEQRTTKFLASLHTQRPLSYLPHEQTP